MPSRMTFEAKPKITKRFVLVRVISWIVGCD